MAKPKYSTDDIAKKKGVDPKRAKTAQGWVEQVLGKKFKGDFFDELQDGTVLCQLMNKLKPGSCKKFKPSKVAFVARSNIQIYVEAAKKYGVPQTDCFETRDLYDKQALHQVVTNIYALSGAADKAGYPGPHIGIKYHSSNKRNFTEEQLIESRKKGNIPKWNMGDKEIKTKNQDAYGIIKTDKDMQKHTGAMSAWEKGSLENKPKGDYDAYGIIKNKDQTKHTGALGVWDKGAKENDNGGKNDDYGIIKGAQDKK